MRRDHPAERQAPLAGLPQRTLREAAWPAPGEARGGKGRGTEVGDHVPLAVASQPQRLMAHAVPNAPGDRAWRSPMALPERGMATMW